MEKVDSQDLPKMQRISPYAEWQAGEGIPIYDTFFVEDMKRLELKRWARLGADAASPSSCKSIDCQMVASLCMRMTRAGVVTGSSRRTVTTSSR
jgi:hypothetical protein